jgi:hypothetical protein
MAELSKVYLKLEKSEMGGLCIAYGGGEMRVQGFGGKS